MGDFVFTNSVNSRTARDCPKPREFQLIQFIGLGGAEPQPPPLREDEKHHKVGASLVEGPQFQLPLCVRQVQSLLFLCCLGLDYVEFFSTWAAHFDCPILGLPWWA